MPMIAAAFASGLLFGIGLVVSQMVNPAKVLGFLDLFGAWDPSLAFVMGGAVAVSALGSRISSGQPRPAFAPLRAMPARRDLDGRLIAGAALFGIGWGLVGLCPGPALVGLSFGLWQLFVFVAAMIAGMAIFRVVSPETPVNAHSRELVLEE